ncbi:hypothetical protein Msi02_44120 [Microbispora siamensis]|uniref:Uncharacterized protein n=1 Tax=Microbispora siamensis TaxID=564413 RepID=A0ABQ4GQH6_9ACTN|nr:hypothetical protein Msi02_44120 [Microbispora siamensis]
MARPALPDRGVDPVALVQHPDRAVDLGLAQRRGAAQPPVEPLVRAEPLGEVTLGEGLHQVVDHPTAQRFADDPRLGGGGEHDHMPAEVRDDRGAWRVRKVLVEQHEVGSQPPGERDGLGGGVGDARHLEPRHPPDIARVEVGDAEVVVDDENPDHGAPTHPVDGAPDR